MHAKIRIPNSGHNSPSPPQSPLSRSPRLRRKQGGGRFAAGQPGTRTLAQRVTWLILSVLLRRQGVFLFAPLLYISGILFYMGTVSFDVVPGIRARPSLGSVYRSPQLFAKLKPEIQSDNSSSDAWYEEQALALKSPKLPPTLTRQLSLLGQETRISSSQLLNKIVRRVLRYLELEKTVHHFVENDKISTIWKHSYKSGEWRPCINASSGGLPESNGYIYIEANGGLNQQRGSICNAVAVAGYLNATLVIPHFHYHSIWQDPSKFGDIYDEEYFVKALENDVQVLDKIPSYIMERFDYNMSNVYNFRIKAWSSIEYYRDTVLPKLLEEKLIRISPFANRLSFDAPPPVQRLRCLANYQALRFSDPISTMGETLVARMKERSKNNGSKYISVHLRFEEDMVAFSCCVYDGGNTEKGDMDAAREKGWRGKFTKPGRVISPGAIRVNGKCPLTPLEVGLMLRGMGFDKNTAIYLASGKIYDSERYMAPLLELFPLLRTKEMLVSAEELAPFQNFSSRMAAIDYTVCLHSEVFVTTQGGNFPHFLLGHRRFLYGGHSRTIRPDKRKLVVIFDNLNIGWRSFKRHMLSIRAHSESKGMQLKRPIDSIYSFPSPDCMCKSNRTEDSKSSSVT